MAISSVMRTFKAALTYFALVFGAGFILGPIRILFVVPRLGVRIAELMEAPIMLTIMIVAASWVVHHLNVPPRVSSRLLMGALALILVIGAEFTVVLWLQGLTIREYLATRDPVSGTVYYLLLVVFAILPLVVARRSQSRKRFSHSST